MRLAHARVLAREWCRIGASAAVALLLAACGRGLTPLAPAPTPVTREPAVPRVPRDETARVTPMHAGPRSSGVSDDDLAALWERQLVVPVDGVRREALRDTYVAARSGGIHGALDILAPRGTPVLSADDGTIGRLADGPIGGIAIYATDPDAHFVYYYAHLDRLRSGLAVGDRVAKGDVIGYVGTTGNAPRDTPHLHFQVMKRAAARAWWSGPPINPISFFAADGAPHTRAVRSGGP